MADLRPEVLQNSGASHELPWLPKPPADFNLTCRQLLSHPEDFGRRVIELASTALDENQMLRLAKAIQAGRDKGYGLEPLASFRIGVVSNATSDFIGPCLVATAARYGIGLECVTTGFGRGVQEVLDRQSAVNQFQPHAVLIAIDWRGLPVACTPGHPPESMVEAVLGHLQTIRDAVKSNANNAVCIIQNLAPPTERFFGSFDRVLQGASRQAIDCINTALAASVRDTGDVLLDVAGLAETVGLENWHSPREWNMAKLPFAQIFLPLFADHVCRIIGALRGKSRRCLVLDLDNTIWGGVIGDDGLSGIQLAEGDPVGEAYRDFQRYILSLREHGVVLAISSKNEDETARSPFRMHPEMLLREQHIALFQANWNDKPTNIQAIANELALGLESLVFVDDNPFERDLVRRTLPQVAVPEMPSDPSLYARTLSAAGYFEAVAFSLEDAKRASYYQANAMRAALQKQVGDLDAYLATLEMEIWLHRFDDLGRTRITQLINKSNQFNLTTRRYTEADVARMQRASDYFTLQVRLKDRFGDNGIISVVICRAATEDEWEIDTWLMSCRVLGRRVENVVLREILAHASQRGVRRLTGVYRPTERNQIVKDHYKNLGFQFLEDRSEGCEYWQLEVSNSNVLDVPMIVHSQGLGQADLRLDSASSRQPFGSGAN